MANPSDFAAPPDPDGAPTGTSSTVPDSTLPPAGWLWDGSCYRWWDGVRWTEHIHAASIGTAPDGDDRTLAAVSHGGLLAGGFILPLVMYLISDDERRPETRFHAREALNFQLTFLAVYLGSMIVLFGTVFVGVFSSSSQGSDELGAAAVIGLVLGFGAMMLLFALNVVFSVIGAVKASRNERWRYPVRIPFVRS